ncbi:F-box domain-containing [Pyrenophora seminiperda CCB06]|uniref:F-box domain-containing n=1 Tax=Pyrenophora seminiperda CCB06 TaxID=1302712 RepID=A0A3M7MDL0_9PLEO|nr:F-box domain-containing [Pyrenophora seminiperda CCB06]
MDSTYSREISDSFATITKLPPPTTAAPPAVVVPILSLPIELIRHVNTYLDTATAASFCLSSRYIYYALGTDVLTRHIDSSKNRFEKRRIIEAVVERAFPGHWFCAWCDKFHAWDAASEGPNHQVLKGREDYNSYLSGSPTYTLRYHHVRLALNAHLWGPPHGIPLSTFSHDQKAMAKISKTPVPTHLRIRALISPSSPSTLLLHTSFAIILPSFTTTSKNTLKHLWPLLPHTLTGHRDTDSGHAGLMAAVDNVVRRGWKYAFTQSCEVCGADWAVGRQEFKHATGGQVRLVVQCWRDLGTGRSPFERGWRAHGEGVGGYG